MDDAPETLTISEVGRALKKHEHKSQSRYENVMAKLDDGIKIDGGSEMGAREDLNVVGVPGMGGGDGFMGGGVLGGLLIGALLGRNGGLFGGNTDGAGANALQSSIDTNSILQSLGDIKAAVPLAEAQVQLALAGAQSDITSQSLQQTIALQNQGFNSQLANLSGFNSVGDKVDALAASTALAIATNQFNCVQATMADGDKTRALIQSIDKQNDSRLITAQANEIIELRAEGNRQADRHGIEINMINNQNQAQAQFQAQAQQLNTLTNCMAAMAQNIQATNQAINIGAGTQTANPTNTNTNVRA